MLPNLNHFRSFDVEGRVFGKSKSEALLINPMLSAMAQTNMVWYRYYTPAVIWSQVSSNGKSITYIFQNKSVWP